MGKKIVLSFHSCLFLSYNHSRKIIFWHCRGEVPRFIFERRFYKEHKFKMLFKMPVIFKIIILILDYFHCLFDLDKNISNGYS